MFLVAKCKYEHVSYFVLQVLRRISEMNCGGNKIQCKPRIPRGINKTIILPVVLYGCETWSLTVREEHKIRVFGNKVLRRIFGPKRNRVTGGWRKLHNEELINCTLR
jgi:hypothetical protein